MIINKEKLPPKNEEKEEHIRQNNIHANTNTCAHTSVRAPAVPSTVAMAVKPRMAKSTTAAAVCTLLRQNCKVGLWYLRVMGKDRTFERVGKEITK